MRKHPEPKVSRTCEHCGKQFEVHAYVVKQNLKPCRWCSQSCRFQSTRVTVVCDYCKQSFERVQSFTNRYESNYCSRRCNNLGRRNPNRAVKHMRYSTKVWQDLRLQVIERDGVCQICGSSLANSVHHKNWNAYSNFLENLVLLCSSCHGRFKPNESWESGKARIVACSDLHGNMQSLAEMPKPASLACV